MAVNRLIDAIRMRERLVAPEDDLVRHTFKITPMEYRDQSPDLVTANGLDDFYHNHTIHEYIELTQRYTLLPSITSMVHEGIAGGVNSQFTVALYHIQTATKLNPNLDPEQSTMIVVQIQSFPPQTGSRDMRASIDIYARDGQGGIKRVDTGGLFRDRDGAMLLCEVELTINHFLPGYERDEFTAGQSIKYDVSEIAEALASDERADMNITNERRLYDISPGYFDGLDDGNE
ncbi:hypothetical protein LTR56_000631 [Elasticomyces elasticus]|nr:hypothetical protein LTR56_000631 [Elasticomyces elasticus]KAK3664408.1 hypothetical protein LTR22_004821 [Elasticomyces elasticus]KAK4919410.1 hypothetical protein LTR49_012944 [Elasticomyces elasticus]KAK5758284.1 hypothetical protein LTS12_011607 [Elasticomyces elasticus]